MNRIERITRHSETSEKAIEAYLVRRVKEMGGICLKYSNPNMAGYPDRICVMPGGRTLWVELKSEGEKPRPLQLARMDSLKRRGHKVYTVSSREGVDSIIMDLLRESIKLLDSL